MNDGFYNGTIFHRVIKNFMAKAVALPPTCSKKTPRPPIENEAKNGLAYTIAMARTGDPHSTASSLSTP